MKYSFIIPVFNRPDEIDELLQSLTQQDYKLPFEVVIIEDGSSIDCKQIVEKYTRFLNINYIFKANSGPGDSRNFGMKAANGDYFLILDSDCILPKQYLSKVDSSLKDKYMDCFGGPDGALDSFSDIQKAINFVMTSILTSGGIRGGSEQLGKFQPRSFNMGLSRKAFEMTAGFGNIHPGEDPDLSIRLWKAGFQTKLIKEAFVYHKRRIDWNKFYIQVNKFGLVRPILNKWHPSQSKLTYWFPSIFILGFLFSAILLFLKLPYFLYFYGIYISIFFLSAILKTRSFKISAFALFAMIVQFFGYGKGFLTSWWHIHILKKDERKVFPKLFFKKF